MKLRYYMRGLGIGIFVTAILMALTIHGKTERLTDEQIIERAEALGMEMKYSSDVLADTVSENAAEDTKPAELPDPGGGGGAVFRCAGGGGEPGAVPEPGRGLRRI